MPHTPATHPGGSWVPREDVGQMTNIAGRAFRRDDGSEGVFPDYTMNPRPVTHWYFAPTPEAD